MTTPTKALMIQAREFIAYHSKYWNGTGEHPQSLMESLTAAIDAPEPEPVAEVAGELNALHIRFLQAGINMRLGDKLYLHPPTAREPLTKAQIDDVVYKCRGDGKDTTYDIVNAAIEAAIGAKP